jgi:hypothetical protein
MEKVAASVLDAVEVDDFKPEDLIPASSLKTRGGIREDRAAKAS